jgi:sialidase-1
MKYVDLSLLAPLGNAVRVFAAWVFAAWVFAGASAEPKSEALAVAAAPEFSDSAVARAGEGGYHTYRIPAAVITRNGTVVLLLEGRKGDHSDFTAIDLIALRSRDGGRTWSKPHVVWSEGSLDDQISIGNPCPVYDEITGRLWCAFNKDNQLVFVTYSDDDGATWSPPRDITPSVRPWNFTRYWTGPGHGLHLKGGPHRGRILFPSYHMALESHNSGAVSRFSMRVHSVYSDDQGKTWQIGQPTVLGSGWDPERAKFKGRWIPGEADWAGCEPTAEELPDGRLYMIVRNQARPAQAKAHTWSHDGGRTWTPLVPHPTIPEPTCQSALIRWQGPRGERPDLYVYTGITMDRGYVENSRNKVTGGRERLAAYISTDDCRSWREAGVIHRRAAAYSDLVALPDGTLLCFYEGGENDPYESIRLARFNREWLESAPR